MITQKYRGKKPSIFFLVQDGRWFFVLLAHKVCEKNICGNSPFPEQDSIISLCRIL